MNRLHTFDELVAQLSIEERLSLLEKIRASSKMISLEPLYLQKDAEVQGVSFEEQYKRQPWLIRILYRIIGLFTSRAAAKVFEDRRVLLMAKSVEAGTLGVFDYRQNHLQGGFFVSLAGLKQAARFFFNVLDTSTGKDRGEFYAILGSLEMGDIHLRLQNECGPRAILASNPNIPPSDLRHAVMQAMDEALQSIPDLKRGLMYHHARSLGYLKDLSCFLFDRFILAFEDSTGGRVCRISATVKELMINLDRILFSLRDPPLPSLFEALFIYELGIKVGEPGFKMDRELESLLDRAEKTLATIRNFNSGVPLTRMIRCITRNLDYFPTQASGGEDWFQIYRGYWKRRLEAELAEYFAQKKHQDIVNSLEDFFGTRLEPLTYVASERNLDGFPLPEAFTLSFLNAFNFILDGKINSVLQPVVLEGEFTRREDKMGITEAYNNIIHVARQIRLLDSKLSSTGEYGKRYMQAKQEPEALPVKRRKMQIIQNDASREAWGIIDRSREGMKKIGAMLEVISSRDLCIEHGRISNFDKLAGKRPAVFTRNVKEAVRSLKQTLKVLNDISEDSKSA